MHEIRTYLTFRQPHVVMFTGGLVVLSSHMTLGHVTVATA